MVKPETTKMFEHDCERCVYVLTTHGDNDYDWYVCPDGGSLGSSVVARYGDDGPNYWSMPACMVRQDHCPVASHYGSDRRSVSSMIMLANIVLDFYERELLK